MASAAEVPTEQLENISIRKYQQLNWTIHQNFSFSFSTEGPAVYTSEKNGSDENGDGSEGKPFKTPLQVLNWTKEAFDNRRNLCLGISTTRRECHDLCGLERWNQSRMKYKRISNNFLGLGSIWIVVKSSNEEIEDQIWGRWTQEKIGQRARSKDSEERPIENTITVVFQGKRSTTTRRKFEKSERNYYYRRFIVTESNNSMFQLDSPVRIEWELSFRWKSKHWKNIMVNVWKYLVGHIVFDDKVCLPFIQTLWK